MAMTSSVSRKKGLMVGGRWYVGGTVLGFFQSRIVGIC